MEKKYIFLNNIQERTPIYEMPEAEFFKIYEANKKIYEVFRLEELFAMLVENFYAFNNVFFTCADRARLQSMLPRDYFHKSLEINRAALNFLAVLNLYTDVLCDKFEDIKSNNIFEKNREIQRCMAIRNYIQHVESFPINANTISSKCDWNVALLSVRFLVDMKKLRLGGLRKGTRDKFNTFFDANEQIDLYEIINRGMGEIQLIQKQVRQFPLYSDYLQSKTFLLDIEKKIAPDGISMTKPCFCIESEQDSGTQTIMTCFLATDTINFIDETILRYPCRSSSSELFVTIAPEDFLKKCSNNIFLPTINQK